MSWEARGRAPRRERELPYMWGGAAIDKDLVLQTSVLRIVFLKGLTLPFPNSARGGILRELAQYIERKYR